MIDKSDLFLIYKSTVSPTTPFELVHFMATNGPIPTDYLQRLSLGHEDLCFEKLAELQSFAFRVGTEMEASAVYILSTEDFNLTLDQAFDRKTFRKIFEKAGERLEIEPARQQMVAKPFLGKILGALTAKNKS